MSNLKEKYILYHIFACIFVQDFNSHNELYEKGIIGVKHFPLLRNYGHTNPEQYHNITITCNSRIYRFCDDIGHYLSITLATGYILYSSSTC